MALSEPEAQILAALAAPEPARALHDMFAAEDAAKDALAEWRGPGCWNVGLVEVDGDWWRAPDWTPPPPGPDRLAVFESVAAAFIDEARPVGANS